MNLQEAIEARHSVRSYLSKKIPQDIRDKLDRFALDCSRDGDVHIFIQYDDPEGFNSGLARYGSFRNVQNYIVLAGKKGGDFSERCGYWEEKLVLYAQQLGLNTCWTALTFNRSRVKNPLRSGESLCMVIALGCGETQGIPHKGKSCSQVSDSVNAPDWFVSGVHAACADCGQPAEVPLFTAGMIRQV